MLLEQDIKRNFPNAIIQSAWNCIQANRVLKIDPDETNHTLSGTVQGNNKLFQATVKWSEVTSQQHAQFKSHCTCPLHTGCQHVVAILLTYVNRNKTHTIGPSHTAPWSINALKQQAFYQKNRTSPSDKKLLFVLPLHSNNDYAQPVLKIKTAKQLKNGKFSHHVKDFKLSSEQSDRYPFDTKDLELYNQIKNKHQNSLTDTQFSSDSELDLISHEIDTTLLTLINAEKLYIEECYAQPLKLGNTKNIQLKWQIDPNGYQQCTVHFDIPEIYLLPWGNYWYIDIKQNIIGLISSDIPIYKLNTIINSKPIYPDEANKLHDELKQLGVLNTQQLPYSIQNVKHQKIHIQKPGLRLYTHTIKHKNTSEKIALAEPFALYDNTRVPLKYPGKEVYIQPKESEWIVSPRNLNGEKEFFNELIQHANMLPLAEINKISIDSGIDHDFIEQRIFHIAYDVQTEEGITACALFNETTAEKLKENGWIIITEGDYPPLLDFIQHDDWYTDISSTSNNHWFDIELGVLIDNKRINILPQLIKMTQSSKNINELSNTITLPNQKAIKIPYDRLELMLNTVREMFATANTTQQGRLRISRYRAALLNEMEKAFSAIQLRWFGEDKLRNLGKKINEFTNIQSVTIPNVFKTELRDYQKRGVEWIQFLRDYELSGILADDMGLGKTVQTLAHLSIEKHHERITHPILIISPTSVVINWEREIERFAPHLKTLILHGTNRHQQYESLNDYDIILTSYALIRRDKEILLEHEFYYVILDEAQFIKNHKSMTTQIIYRLNAKHRLCLTGTPLENHLGELWSLFQFLLPGLLGTQKSFNQKIRFPIEKEENKEQQYFLSKLIKPFVLRRTKENVAQELPEKTEIILPIDLTEKQRDLYEMIRVTLHEKLKKTIDQKGFEQSQIYILDALLKLRQTCCDPRLVKLESAQKVNESAKLTTLVEHITELLSEGRQLLIFSQFTSMLSLIEKELIKEKIDYALLTGETKDRRTPINAFQSKQVPVFLLSLKAGGTGLNLTSADTVIHYDPWWNPAVEQQATDRAHRIGQDKPVFVYKMIATNTIEEKMLAMQKRKQSLANTIYEAKSPTHHLSREDLEWLLS